MIAASRLTAFQPGKNTGEVQTKTSEVVWQWFRKRAQAVHRLLCRTTKHRARFPTNKFVRYQCLRRCWCGKSTDKPERYGTSKSCNTDCAGDHSIKKCGGKWAMDMYERDGKPDGIPSGAKYLGCFADDYRDRALTLKMKTSSKMDYDVRVDAHTRAGLCPPLIPS